MLFSVFGVFLLPRCCSCAKSPVASGLRVSVQQPGSREGTGSGVVTFRHSLPDACAGSPLTPPSTSACSLQHPPADGAFSCRARGLTDAELGLSVPSGGNSVRRKTKPPEHCPESEVEGFLLVRAGPVVRQDGARGPAGPRVLPEAAELGFGTGRSPPGSAPLAHLASRC